MSIIVLVGFTVIFLLLMGSLALGLFEIAAALNKIASALLKLFDKQTTVEKKYYIESNGLIYEFLGIDRERRSIVRPCPDIKLLPEEQKTRPINKL